VGSIIRRYSPFLNFLKVQDDLLLEEIHMDSTDPSAAPTTLYTNDAPPTARPPSSTPSRHPAVTTTVTVATGTITTTRTAMVVMVVATTTGTTTPVVAVITLLARLPSPLPLTAELARHG
jgi:hypothetical protein